MVGVHRPLHKFEKQWVEKLARMFSMLKVSLARGRFEERFAYSYVQPAALLEASVLVVRDLHHRRPFRD